MNDRALDKNSVESLPARDRIMDAAEELFSLRGYEGATVREITRRAKVPLGLANHHFVSKDCLFREVIARRAVTHVSDIQAELDRVITQIPMGGVEVEDVIEAYIGPLMRRAAQGDIGWRNYCRLIGLTLNSPQYHEYVRSTVVLFDENYITFISAIKLLISDVDEKSLHWCTYFLEASVLHILVQAGMVDKQSGGLCRSEDFAGILTELVPFFAHSFRYRLSAGQTS